MEKSQSIYLPNEMLKCLKSIPDLPQLVEGKVYKIQIVQKSKGIYFLTAENQRPFKISSSIVEDPSKFKKISN